jgi:hypothetical protein
VLEIYRTLAQLAQDQFSDICTQSAFVGGTSASPNKLRLTLTDSSFLDIWLSSDGDYAYHWEQRRQSGRMYRWDNAPHHPHLTTFPAHFHNGDEPTVVESHLNPTPEVALSEILTFVRQQLR